MRAPPSCVTVPWDAVVILHIAPARFADGAASRNLRPDLPGKHADAAAGDAAAQREAANPAADHRPTHGRRYRQRRAAGTGTQTRARSGIDAIVADSAAEVEGEMATSPRPCGRAAMCWRASKHAVDLQ